MFPSFIAFSWKIMKFTGSQQMKSFIWILAGVNKNGKGE